MCRNIRNGFLKIDMEILFYQPHITSKSMLPTPINIS